MTSNLKLVVTNVYSFGWLVTKIQNVHYWFVAG